MRIVAPFGFYGSGNIGDEATLQGFARLLELTGVSADVWIGSRSPSHTRRIEPRFHYFGGSRYDPRRWWAKLRASAHAIIGGTPIMDILGEWPLNELTPLVQSIDRWNVPLAFVGVGIENLRREESRRIIAEEFAPRVRHWSVRCERDGQRLADYGVSPDAVAIAADMAWLIEPATKEFGLERLQGWAVDPQRPLIGVNLVNENSQFDQQPRMVDALAAALDDLAGKWDAQVIFLSNEVREGSMFDKAAAKQVIDRMKRADRTVLAPNEYLSPRQMMSIISCCALTLSMRYHFCLFSALQRVPFIAIERSDKVSDLCWDLDWQARVVPPRFEAGDIVEHANGLRNAAAASAEKLEQIVSNLKERALRNLIALNVLRDSQHTNISGKALASR